MNRALLNPFEVRDLPKGIEDFLEQQEKATCMRFNRHGNLLAVGTRTGKVVIWDFDTHSIATTLGDSRPHFFPVSSVSFPAPRNGSYVLVSYEPGLVCLFDTLSTSLVTQISFQVSIISAVPHPKRPDIAIVIPKDSHPLIFHLKRGIYRVDTSLFADVKDPELILRVPADKDNQNGVSGTTRQIPKRPKHAFGNNKIAHVPNRSPWIPMSVLCAKHEFVNGKHVDTNAARRKSPYCVTFTRGGRYILRGGSAGVVRAFRLSALPDVPGSHFSTAQSVAAVVIQGKAAVRSIQLSRRDEKVLINSQDRAMRLFTLEQLVENGSDKRLIEPKTTFTEIVNKSQCQSACFSRDGDFVLGGMEGTDHRIHVWRTADGFLDLTLEGPREGIVEILWHPLRPVIASLGSNVGGVYVWMKNFTENWSAFAAEFNELEANEEYKEAEDEFDLKDPEDDEKRLEARERAEAKDVDIETIDASGWFSSDSDDEDTFFFIPAVPKKDSVSNYESLADDIITEKLAETRQRSPVVDEEELEAGHADGRVTHLSEGRKHPLSSDGKELRIKNKRQKQTGRRRTEEILNAGNGQAARNGQMNDESDVEVGENSTTVGASTQAGREAAIILGVEEEVLEGGQVENGHR